MSFLHNSVPVEILLDDFPGKGSCSTCPVSPAPRWSWSSLNRPARTRPGPGERRPWTECDYRGRSTWSHQNQTHMFLPSLKTTERGPPAKGLWQLDGLTKENVDLDKLHIFNFTIGEGSPSWRDLHLGMLSNIQTTNGKPEEKRVYGCTSARS